MPIKDINDPASHCLGLTQPIHTPFEYGQSFRTFASTIAMSTISPDPPTQALNFENAFKYLFELAKHEPSAVALCQEIQLPMVAPADMGLLSYLLRLEAIGKLDSWPCLFGEGNTFVLHLIDKIQGRIKFPEDSENEKMVWDQRKKETNIWVMSRLKHSRSN